MTASRGTKPSPSLDHEEGQEAGDRPGPGTGPPRHREVSLFTWTRQSSSSSSNPEQESQRTEWKVQPEPPGPALPPRTPQDGVGLAPGVAVSARGRRRALPVGFSDVYPARRNCQC